MEPDQIFNLAEAVLWFAVASILLIRSRRPSTHRRLLRVSSAAFFLFGLSDLIEIFTRAWYQPIALLVLNVICVITLIACGLFYTCTRRPE